MDIMAQMEVKADLQDRERAAAYERLIREATGGNSLLGDVCHQLGHMLVALGDGMLRLGSRSALPDRSASPPLLAELSR